MRLVATIDKYSGLVRKAIKYNDMGVPVWRYYLEPSNSYEYRLTEIIGSNYNYGTGSQAECNYIVRCPNLNDRRPISKTIHHSRYSRTYEIYHGNGKIAERVSMIDRSLNSIGKPAKQLWYENGMRRAEYYFTMGKLNNPAGPAVCKWDDRNVLTRCRYYSHGQRIHLRFLTKRSLRGNNE